MIAEISKWLLQGNNLAYATVGFVGFFMLMYIGYNVISFYILKEKYHGIRFTTKNIAYITMFAAISVSVTVVISLTVPITVFPPIRVAFEGVMVKITGFIFGPIVGIIVGLITELLVTIFVPSFIHPAYIFLTIAFGFISGIGSSFLRTSKGKEWVILLLIHLFVFLFGTFMYFVIGSYSGTINLMGFEMSSQVYKMFFIVSLGLVLISVWITVIVIKWKEFKRISSELKKAKIDCKDEDWSEVKRNVIKENKTKVLKILLPIILFAIALEFIGTTLISAWGDAEFLGIKSGQGYAAMVITRLVQAPLKIIFNSFVLYFTYVAVRPLIKRDR